MTPPEGERLDPTAEFQSHRPALLGLAYRLLGSMWDAEDVVADAYEKWMRADHGAVRTPRAFLVTAVSRLAVDALTSARARREAYPGPWLPEPVATADLGPAETVELDDTVAYATLHLMERLSPPERAVVVLREAFAMPYDRIGEILGASAAACRQMQHRAQTRLAAERPPGEAPSPAEHRRLLERFLEAARTGDLDGLTGMLSADVIAWNDGGGKVRSAPRPVRGRAHVAAFVAGLVRRFRLGPVAFVEVNGQIGIEVVLGDDVSVVAVDARDGVITAVYTQRNPDKLAHVARAR